MKRSIFLAAALSMLSLPVFAQSDTSAIRVCTGGQSGKYFQTASEIGRQLKGSVDVQVVETVGSIDNLRLLSSGQCDAAIVQSDAYGIFNKTNPTAKLDFERVVPLYNEYVQLVCNREAGINKVGDLRGKDRSVMVGPAGSGTAVTWQTWTNQAPDYQKVPTDIQTGTRAISLAVDGTEHQCLLFVSGLGSGTMIKVNELGKGSLGLVSIDDGWFDDVLDPKGKRVYEFSKIPGGTYPNLQNYGFLGGQSDVPTLTLQAVLIANSSWIDAHSTAYEDFSSAAIRWSQQQQK